MNLKKHLFHRLGKEHKFREKKSKEIAYGNYRRANASKLKA